MIRRNPRGDLPVVHDSAFVDPTAILCGRVVIHENVFIGPYAVIRADEVDANGHMEPIVIGAHSNIQDGVVIHSKSGAAVTIGERTSIAHRAIVHGPCTVDLNLPERLGAFYIGPDGEKHLPVMLHRALFGSLEWFTGILLEHYAGKLPLWLAPVQAVVATITSDGDPYASEVAGLLMAHGLRVETDLRNEKIGYKIREHSLAKVPVLLVVGKREAKEGNVSLRRIGRNDNETLTLREATVRLETEALRSTRAPASYPNESPREVDEQLPEAVAR